MATKKEGTRITTSYEFTLTHADVVSLMNDAQVQLQEGNVSSNQVFQLNLTKASGSGGDIRLRQFSPNDKLVFKFNVVVQDGTAENLGNLDVEA